MKLRFKGFSGAWVSCKLEDVCDIIGGGTPDTTMPTYWNGNIQWFTPTEMKKKYATTSLRTITPLGLQNSAAKILPKGALLLTSRATIGDVSIATQDCTTNQGFQSLIVKNTIINEFLYYWILKNKNTFLKRASGSTFLEISKKEIAKLLIKMPNLAEQQKIADFLSLVDVKIEKLGTKIELLKTYKKGMMQKIFSQKFRFKQANGNPFPAWTNTTLGNVSTITMGQSPQSSNYNNAQIGLPLIQGNADCINRKTNPKVYTSQITKTCNIGDIIMTVRAPVGNIAKSMHIACIGRGVCSINHNSHMICSDYLYQFLLYSESNWQVLAQGSTFTSINSKQIYNFPIQLPSLPEQQKIATLLSSLDQQIDLLTQQHTLLIQQKKSYLSALL